jgi:hypothetical protein
MKGQAALEFLMTYGWAILLLVLVTGFLVFSGILNPSNFIAEQCSFGNNFGCNFFMVNQDGATQITIEIFNGFAYEVKIIEMQVQTEDRKYTFSGFATNVSLESGDSAVFEGTLDTEIAEAGKFVGNITYVSCASEIGADCSDVTHIVSGRIRGRLTEQ